MKLFIFLVSFIILQAKTIVVDARCSLPFLGGTRCIAVPIIGVTLACERGDNECDSGGIISVKNCEFATISAALKYLDDGDEIRVCPSTYKESNLKIILQLHLLAIMLMM